MFQAHMGIRRDSIEEEIPLGAPTENKAAAIALAESVAADPGLIFACVIDVNNCELVHDVKPRVRLKWLRRKIDGGETVYLEERGRFQISKWVVDDRETDGGYLTVSWFITKNPHSTDYEVLTPADTLKAAKAACERDVNGEGRIW